MTTAEYTKGLTQGAYEKLLSGLAGAIGTQRRFIEIISAECVNACTTRFKVKRKGEYYPYLIEQLFYPYGLIYLNLGLVI